jgi:putative MFS transporter
LPESPRWLAQRGRQAEAEAIMQMMEQRVRDETGHDLPEPRLVTGETEVAKGSWMEIWQGPYFGRTVMMIAYNLLQTIGYYGFATWVPTLLLSQGITVTKSLEYTFIIAIAIAVFGLIFWQQTSAIGIVVAGILVTLANNRQSFSFHAYQAELYPTRVRAQAVGFVYSWSRFSSIFTGFIIAAFLASYRVTGVFVFIAAAMVLVFAIVGFWGPKTSGLRLEAIAR